MNDDRRFELPEGMSREEERAILRALERYFLQESPHPHPWVLAGRMDATGWGALQVRHLSDGAWATATGHVFVRPGVAPLGGRGDAA